MFWSDYSYMTSVELLPERLSSYDCVLIAADHTSYEYEAIVRNSMLVVGTRNATRNRIATKLRTASACYITHLTDQFHCAAGYVHARGRQAQDLLLDFGIHDCERVSLRRASLGWHHLPQDFLRERPPNCRFFEVPTATSIC